MGLKEYNTVINGQATTLQLSDEDAKLQGFTSKDVVKKAAGADDADAKQAAEDAAKADADDADAKQAAEDAAKADADAAAKAAAAAANKAGKAPLNKTGTAQV